MRVLHLIDGTRGPAGGEGGGALERAAAACALLSGGGGGGEQQTIVIGGSGAGRRARLLGAPRTRWIAPAIGKPLLAWRALCGAWPRAQPDVVHCWGAEMLELSRLAFPGRVGRVAVVERPGGGALAIAGDWLGAPLSRALLLCPAWARASLEECWRGPELAPVPPPAGVGAGPGREEVRGRLGLEKGDTALLFLNRRVDAVRVVYLLGLAAAAGVRIVGVAPRRAAVQGGRGRRLRKSSRLAIRLVESDLPGAVLARGCDIGVWEPGGAGATSPRVFAPGEASWDVAPALLAGLAVVAPRKAIDSAMIPPDAVAACLAANGTVPELARIVLSLAVDPGGRGALAERCQEHAAAADWGGGFVRAVRGAWAGAAAARPAERPGAGATGVRAEGTAA